MDLHWTVTVVLGTGDGATVVVGVTAMTHVPEAQGNFISGPACSTIVCAVVSGSTIPLICSVCPNASPTKMHPAAITNEKIFAFMLPLNRETQCGCKLSLVRLLGEWFGSSRNDSLL